MSRKPTLIAATALVMLCGTILAEQPRGFWTTPAIDGYGTIHYLPRAAYTPQADQTYKVVFALTEGAKDPTQVNPALWHVARAVNLYTAAGVPLSHLKFVAVASGAATPLSLDDTHYRSAFGVPNPNLPLIERLRSAGIDVSVCGQAVAEHDYQYDWVDKHVTLTLSALTTVTTLEHQGWGLVPM